MFSYASILAVTVVSGHSPPYCQWSSSIDHFQINHSWSGRDGTVQLQQLAAGGAGEGLREHALPRNRQGRGARSSTGAHLGQSPGSDPVAVVAEVIIVAVGAVAASAKHC